MKFAAKARLSAATSPTIDEQRARLQRRVWPQNPVEQRDPRPCTKDDHGRTRWQAVLDKARFPRILPVRSCPYGTFHGPPFLEIGRRSILRAAEEGQPGAQDRAFL